MRTQLNSPTHRSRLAFTMIEIAISLAIIGFALVAIIGILPTAMSGQRTTREETVIGQDAGVFMNLIRNGEQGQDDLTNYVMAITNYVSKMTPKGAVYLGQYGYTYSNSSFTPNGGAASPTPTPFPITNCFRIIGLLSTPKFTWVPQQGVYFSNHVVAFVHSMSGPASEKAPQNNQSVQELGLSYRMISDVLGYNTNYFDPAWTNYSGLPTNSLDYVARWNNSVTVSNLQLNLHDLRLTFRWPLLPNGDTGPGRQVFRTLVTGPLATNYDVGVPLYFFQPKTYVKAP